VTAPSVESPGPTDCDMFDGEMRAPSSVSKMQASSYSLERTGDAGSESRGVRSSGCRDGRWRSVSGPLSSRTLGRS